MLRRSLAVVTLFLPASMSAQVGPGLLAPHAPSTWLDMQLPPLSAFSASTAWMVSLSAAKLSNNPPGVWTLCLSVGGVTGCAGCSGAAGTDTLIATVDLNTAPPTLVLTNEAQQINTINTGYEDMFKLEPRDGLKAVYDTYLTFNGSMFFTGIQLVDRPGVGTQFSNPRPILNVNGIFRSFADPAIGFVDEGDGNGSKLKLFWVGVNYIPGTFTLVRGIWMQDLDDTTTPATPFVRGPLKLVAVESRPGWAINSPAPIVGGDGDVEGMLVWERNWQSTGTTAANNPRDNDAFFADDFDWTTPNTEAMDTAGTWSNNGTMLGNLMLAAETFSVYPYPTTSPPVIYQIAHEGASTWLLGDTEPVASADPLDIRVGAPNGSTVFVLIAPSLLPAPVQAPAPVSGWVGISAPQMLCILTVGPDAIADFPLPTPASPSLAGTIWPIQGVAATATGLTTTNTAKLRLR
jgi:hypothetical protein